MDRRFRNLQGSPGPQHFLDFFFAGPGFIQMLRD
jgi:hypothetical protein